MVTVESQNPVANPTPECEEECRQILHDWTTGRCSFRDAINRLASMAQKAEAGGWQANLARIEHLLGYIQHDRGHLNTSLMHFERSRTMYESVGNWQRVAVMDLNMGEAYRYKGDFMRARYLYRKAYESANKFNMVELKTLAVVNEGLMLIHMGRGEAALSALAEGYQLAKQWPPDAEQSLPALLAELHCGLAVVYVDQGSPAPAWQHARQALEAAKRSEQPIQVGIACRVMGDVLTRFPEQVAIDSAGQLPDPDDHYQQAMNILREIHADAELAHTLFAHGRSLAKRGRRLNAARQLQQAMIIYTRLDMILDAASAARAQLEVTA